MASFDMDPERTRSGLASADVAGASQPSSSVLSVHVGGYTMPLMAAVMAARRLHQVSSEVQVAHNTARREVSVNTVELAEAANSAALDT